MKLFYCEACGDIIKLTHTLRYCACGRSEGKYKDNIKAILSGECVPIGVVNSDFVHALKNQPQNGFGKNFTAFVIPESCETIAYY